jgi:hypothetical protein
MSLEENKSRLASLAYCAYKTRGFREPPVLLEFRGN